MDPPGGPDEFEDVLHTDRFHNDAYPSDKERLHLTNLLHFDYSDLRLSNLLVGWIGDLNTYVTNSTAHSNRAFRGLLYRQLQRFKNFFKITERFWRRNAKVKEIFAEVHKLEDALLGENAGVVEDELELCKVDFDDLVEALQRMHISSDELQDLNDSFRTMYITTALDTLYKVLNQLLKKSPIYLVVSLEDGLDDQDIKHTYTANFTGYAQIDGTRRRIRDHVMHVTYNENTRMVEIVEAPSRHTVFNNDAKYQTQCNTENASSLFNTIFTAYKIISTKRGFEIYSHPFAALDKSMDPWAAIHKLTCMLERSLLDFGPPTTS